MNYVYMGVVERIFGLHHYEKHQKFQQTQLDFMSQLLCTGDGERPEEGQQVVEI